MRCRKDLTYKGRTSAGEKDRNNGMSESFNIYLVWTCVQRQGGSKRYGQQCHGLRCRKDLTLKHSTAAAGKDRHNGLCKSIAIHLVWTCVLRQCNCKRYGQQCHGM